MSDSTLLDAIARAGGLAPEAGPEILVTRKEVKSNGIVESNVQHIPTSKLMNADPEVNVRFMAAKRSASRK